MAGIIFDLQRFCTSDGPGIRTTVFLKGCPLRCLWCHNPESQRREREIMRYPEKCTGCGRCRAGAITEEFVCFSGAQKVCGREVTAEYVVAEALKDRLFYETSGGGLTLSGGEPLAQADFALELLQRAKENGLHTAVETCGFADRETLHAIAEVTDLFLFDYKETDPELHRQFTGVDNRLIGENLHRLDEWGKAIVLRCPLIPGCNDRAEHLAGIAQTANRLNHVLRVELEPYHTLGEHKYAALGKLACRMEPLPKERVEEMLRQVQQQTHVPVKLA